MAPLHLVLFPFSILVGWLIHCGTCLFRNYREAQNIGVPIVTIPISHENPLWMLVDKKFFIPLLEHLPFGLGKGNVTRYNWRGWEFQDKSKSHEELGDVFVMIQPGRNFLYVCNAEALMEIFRRRSDFPRPLEIFEMVNVFGLNLSTTDGQQWQRHRKVTATCFNEENNELVWAETIRQAQGMLHYWCSEKVVRSLADDTRTLSLHVLSAAGFGKSYPFQGHSDAPSSTTASSYKESLQTILDNCILLFVCGQRFLAKRWLPSKLKSLHKATVNFKNYTTEVYEEEKQSIVQGKTNSRNLMTSLVRASMTDQVEPNGENGLTESELYGNMFVFNFAGHDTTAHSLAFVVALLSAHPEVQDWVSEEVHYVFGDRDPSEWSYQKDFANLKRCLAVFLETLRLYPPVPIAKCTGPEPRTLNVNDKTLVIPANTLIIPNNFAIQTHPKYWGEDCLQWRPSRWIATVEALPLNANGEATLAHESLIAPHKGSFIAWSEGIRNCPGKKFSQVEFAASIAVLFRHCRVSPVPEMGEDLAMARDRVRKTVAEDTGQVLLLQLLHPERIVLRWHPACESTVSPIE